MENFTPYSALFGGVLIGLSATLLLWFNGRIAGVSGIFFQTLTANRDDRSWRLLFVLGLIVGVALYQWLLPAVIDMSQLGLTVTAPRVDFPPGLLAAAGLLVGFGTAMGSGCTSGHGVCGIARLSARSIIATVVFLVTGAVTVYAVRHIGGVL